MLPPYGPRDGTICTRFDSGNLSVAIAIPRDRAALTIDGYAVARDGSGQLRIGPLESAQVRLDVTSFQGYGPHAVDVECVFDDGATVQAISLLPMDREWSPDNVTTQHTNEGHHG